MKKIRKLSILVISVFLGFYHSAVANVSLPEIFSDNMVLQQNTEVKFRGWAKPGETVNIKGDWMDESKSVKVESQGTWEIKLKTPGAGGPYNITIKGYNKIVLKNVLIGEVWLCSGQSNMEWTAMAGINNREEEIAAADYPEIRLFTVQNSSSLYPQEHCTGVWKECSPETMKDFSAVAYFFGRQLQKEMGVPVGLINSSWGGTPAEAWMPEEVIENDDFLQTAAALQKTVPWGPVEPARIYNAMIFPLIPFRIAGALWYQGEANTINGYAYTALLSNLIASWRNNWGYNFPFYFAQIAPYKYGRPFEGVIVREAQRKTLEKVENTGMVVLSDIGDTTNIHPKNKQDVGLRFANLALNRYYETEKIEDSGPLFKSMDIDKNKVLISFEHAAGLHAKGNSLGCFEIAGADGIYYPAEAKIKGEKVIVQSKKIKEPLNVRFAWSNTATPNLFNGAGLPASCFSTE
ncbi:sialate O-acetylesterase [Maribellus comscasis]|uniref:Sialate O-acetylesterase n=1 Tax=Maribellus comscasis TaxID=2681766 RepID=A0A6I6JR33_9BACT|nr:sialate O-acetylesterase [Maribellus comscasis]QGY42682.1 sialate O-acetylesterase [Maribellus comscasis]